MDSDNVKAEVQKSEKAKAVLTIVACVLTVCLVSQLFFNLVGRNNIDGFEKYLEKSNIEFLPSGAMYLSPKLERDDDLYYAVASFTPYFEKDFYGWANLDRDAQIKDMKFFMDSVIKYAKSEEWGYNYYLYVTANVGGSINFVYNCKTRTFYYPEDLNLYKKMYSKFNTMSPSDLIGNKAGEQFLINNEMCKKENGKIEITYLPMSYTVYVYKGKFTEFGNNSLECAA